MLNINGKLLDKLNANQYYLLSILLNYGKKSRPSNAVLRFKTGWAMQKLQKIKRELVEVGVLKINAKSEKKNGATGSNEYLIKTKLASKYNGSPVRENHVIEIQLTEKQIHEIQLTEKHVSDFHGDLKVLKLSVIEKVKLLKEESDRKALSHIKKLELEIEQLKTELKNKEKSPPKKESEMDVPFLDDEEKEQIQDDFLERQKGAHKFPSLKPEKSYNQSDKRQNKQLPFTIVTAKQTLDALFPNNKELEEMYNSVFSERATDEIFNDSRVSFIEKGIGNYYKTIRTLEGLQAKFLEWIKKEVKFRRNQADKPRPKSNSSNPLFMGSESLNHRNTWNK